MTQTAFSGRLKRWPVVSNISLAWDTLNYAWDTRVLSFDAEEQQIVLLRDELGGQQRARAPDLGGDDRAGDRRDLRALDAVEHAFARRSRCAIFTIASATKAARTGAQRTADGRTTRFLRRARAQLMPAESQRIERITEAYIALRYSARPCQRAPRTPGRGRERVRSLRQRLRQRAARRRIGTRAQSSRRLRRPTSCARAALGVASRRACEVARCAPSRPTIIANAGCSPRSSVASRSLALILLGCALSALRLRSRRRRSTAFAKTIRGCMR